MSVARTTLMRRSERRARAVAAAVGHTWREVLLDEDAPRDLGRPPGHTLPPLVRDMGAAAAMGCTPVGDHPSTVAAEVR